MTHRSLTRASSSSFVHWCVHSFRACSGSRHAHTTEKRRSRVHSTIAWGATGKGANIVDFDDARARPGNAGSRDERPPRTPARASHLRSARALSLLLSCSSACFGTTSSIADHALGALGAPRRSAVCETSGRLEANAEVESARARARPPFHDQTHGWGAQDHVEICFRPRQRPGCPARSEPQPAAASSSVRTAVCHQNRTLPTSKSARIQSPRHLPRPSRAHVRWPTALGDARRARPTMARAAAQPDRLCRYNSLRTLARGPALRAIAEHRAASSQASPDADVESKPLRADAAPQTPPASAQQVERLAEFVTRCKNLMVLTGAGLSTESGIPDYRGPRGAYKTGFKPMMHQQFLASETNRRRYWARSFVGWQEFAGGSHGRRPFSGIYRASRRAMTRGRVVGPAGSKPNAGHAALARLEGAGWVSGIVTQNVDRLHQRAGSERVVELHGTTHEVVCLDCGHIGEGRGACSSRTARLARRRPLSARNHPSQRTGTRSSARWTPSIRRWRCWPSSSWRAGCSGEGVPLVTNRRRHARPCLRQGRSARSPARTSGRRPVSRCPCPA